jgi:hypothetical protein
MTPRQCPTGADGTLPLAGLPASLLKYQQIPDLYNRINGVTINLKELTPLTVPEESQASIMADGDNRTTGVSVLAVIKFVLDLALKKMAQG